MKYIVILGDGMADYPIPQLGNKTPLQHANKPNMDYLARNGVIGFVKTIPDGMPPGSDTANLSVMGYDPEQYLTGRSPLEAVSMGVDMSQNDVSFRCNLVTLSEEEEYSLKTMIDYSSDEISSDEAAKLIEEVNIHFKSDKITFHPGISYRHCMIWKDAPVGFDLTPPHDILEKKIAAYLPKGSNNEVLSDIMKGSYSFLKNHPVNINRVKRGLRPANSVWLWGEGKKPALPMFSDKYGIKGSVISAVDLVKGIGICAGLKSIDVEGATGTIHSNFSGKAQAALEELRSGQDFIYIHLEAPDESGHRYEIENKVRAIELIDEKIVGPIIEGLKEYDDFSIMVLPDHPTPLSLRTHTAEPVPFLIYRKSNEKSSGVTGFDEFQAKETKLYIEEGHMLMDRFIK